MANPPGILLALESVTKSFDGFKAINDLTFYLDHGEMRSVIGPNGAAKAHSWTSSPAARVPTKAP